MNNGVYCEAVFDRGSGLGNRLFPWARCAIYSNATRTPMLAPWWVQARLGPLMRGGLSLSAYHRQILLLGLFQTNAYVSGAERLIVSTTGVRCDEAAVDSSRVASSRRPVIVRFRGYRNLFLDLMGHREFLLARLRSEAKSRWVRLADSMAAPIGINVRCANDFKVAQREADYVNQGALKTPIRWFAESLAFVRRLAGASIPAVVVSDGTPAQLQQLMSMPNVRLARPGCAISDLLTLAQSRILLGSGGSSFSAWASFLSGAPTLTYPGQSLQWFKVDPAGIRYVGDFDPAVDLPHPLAGQLRMALGLDVAEARARL